MVTGGAADAEKIVDRKPVPQLLGNNTVHTAYVDNSLAFGTDATAVREKVRGVMTALDNAGLVVEHDDPICRRPL